MMGPPASDTVENRVAGEWWQRLPHSMVQKNVETQCGHVFMCCTEDVPKDVQTIDVRTVFKDVLKLIINDT